MKAVGYKVPGPIAEDAALVDVELPQPVAAGYDILVEVKAVSVNPVDYKVRGSSPPADGEWKVLGWDASGIVREVGPDVTQFQPGDEVYYAGSITRPGTNAEFHLVDARIVGRKPASLDWAEAAALPLTTLTAWEAMFDRLDVAKPVPGAAPAILIIGGAGGVGSIAIQIARQRTDLTVITTASRAETQEWVKELGAHHVIDHRRPLAAQIAELGIGAPAFVFSTTHTEQHAADIAELIAPQGRFALIDDPTAFDIMLFKRKAVSIHHELMFTRSIYGTPDMHEQGKILDALAVLVDEGKIRTTLTERLSPINAANLKTVHALIESGAAKGKIVLEGF
ncbi:Zn-dependent oxidoreductase [Sphingopyxis sp. H038]|uniref:zinc-binding alcohol dehydrogenase family protein n=1 Tax=unclassified Sphingopyxis TaxID=2614943 RepID=UPI000730D1AA|nr:MULTISPECIES: zinc-binding alcohol dehydrogenase family protein [unclassified Sphingopyxis]KTE02558.1 Zn-dependent oxidoreductase [Sphingopyxis sp. H012]KTE11119.1 Zn-dependent oxidoreductase [Sphingopyxis sp. H053]KTE12282.1 Zn-dependent oxidoreductase [Sphingopyxis sp. H093]KTE30602.1 Zn-dependent oxidoreductase [Sphingopyxis sp. H080]KTE35607.1 Zn-dependent oxidoreductase [Sphingopyxis sp. H038]